MNISIVISPADGYGDVAFGCKLAKHQSQTNPSDNVSLVLYKHSSYKSFLDGFDFHKNTVHMPIKAFEEQLEKKPSSVDLLILGPSLYYYTYRLHNFARHTNINKDTPILFIEEYSMPSDAEKSSEYYKNSGFSNVKVLRSGLGVSLDKSKSGNTFENKLEKGIFIEKIDSVDEGILTKDTVVKKLLGKSSLEKFRQEVVLSIAYTSSDKIFFEEFKFFYKKYIQICCPKKKHLLLVVGLVLKDKFRNQLETLNVKVINDKQVENKSLQLCYQLANGLGACTGDQSLSETISAGLVPVYEMMKYKEGVAATIARELMLALSPEVKKNKTLYSAYQNIVGWISGAKERSAKLEIELNKIDKNNFKQCVHHIKKVIASIIKNDRYNLYRSVDIAKDALLERSSYDSTQPSPKNTNISNQKNQFFDEKTQLISAGDKKLYPINFFDKKTNNKKQRPNIEEAKNDKSARCCPCLIL